MPFVVLLFSVAVALATASGYFSVSGLSEVYAASPISVIIMGSFLEAAKLVVASFLHNFWHKTNTVMKGILCLMLTALMFITSYGVFGHLVAAYQKNSVPLTNITQQINEDTDQVNRLIARKQQIDQQIANLPNNYARSRSSLIKSFGKEYTDLPNQIDDLNKKIDDLKSQELNTQAQVGPIVYLAKVLNQDPDITIFYFTILLTLVFDPLAITLVFAGNIALAHHNEKKNAKEAEINKSLEQTFSVDYSDDKTPENLPVESIIIPPVDHEEIIEEPAVDKRMLILDEVYDDVKSKTLN
jgi:cell division protein FtsB